MGLFDKGVDPEDFDSFKQWVQDQLEKIDSKVASSTTESAENAQNAAEQAIQSKEKIKSLEPEIIKAVEEIGLARKTISEELESIKSERLSNISTADELKEKSALALSVFQDLSTANDSTGELVKSIEQKLDKVSSMLATTSEIPETLGNLQRQVSEATSQFENIKSLLSHSLKRKSEIDELHKRIFGHDISDEAGESEHVDGLVDELESAYKSLSDKLESLESSLDIKVDEITSRHDAKRSSQESDFTTLINEGNSKISEVEQQLKTLLPGGLAAGLSAAYEKKTEEEAKFLGAHERSFRVSIYGLVGVSIIPFLISIYMLLNQSSLEMVLRDTPRIIISILPLYFPVLWLAYSANKRLNLSKRLIEEYTHKSVLGKTFSGLSNQIETLPHESAVRDELRTRLLFNVLQVSAENPGKLITDYNKSDHPLMDVLEKSARLSESIDILSKIPGFSKMAKSIAERRDTLLRTENARVEDGLAVNEDLNSDPTERGAG